MQKHFGTLVSVGFNDDGGDVYIFKNKEEGKKKEFEKTRKKCRADSLKMRGILLNCVSVTLLVIHFDKSALKVLLLRKTEFMFVTPDTSQDSMLP